MYNVQCTYMSNIGTTVERFNGQTTISLTGDKTHILKSTFLSFFPPSVCLSQLAGYTTTTRVFWTSLLCFGARLLAPLLEVGLGICKIVPYMGAFEFYRWARFGLRDHERAVVRWRLRGSIPACPRRGRQAISSAHVCSCPVISYYSLHFCHFKAHLLTHVTLNMSVLLKNAYQVRPRQHGDSQARPGALGPLRVGHLGDRWHRRTVWVYSFTWWRGLGQQVGSHISYFLRGDQWILNYV